MFILVGGYNRDTPLQEIMEGWPYLRVELIKTNPEKTYEWNKKLVQSVMSFIEDPIFLTKSYGSYVTLDAISNAIIFCVGLPLKYKDKIYPFPGNNKETYLIYGTQDEDTIKIVKEKYSDKFKELLILNGNHSLEPLTEDKLMFLRKKIWEVIKNEKKLKQGFGFGLHNVKINPSQEFFSFFSFFAKKSQAKVEIEESEDYQQIEVIGETNKRLEKLRVFVDDHYGPVTHVVKRKSFLPGVYIVQTNIVDTGKLNPFSKYTAATGGIGISQELELAIESSILEALERYSLTLGYVPYVKSKYSDLPEELKPEQKHLIYLPSSLYGKIINGFKIVDPLNSEIEWVLIKNNSRELFWPYQLVYGNYMSYMIHEPSSTGTAIDYDLEHAKLKALYEAIERNSLVRWFYRDPLIKAKKFELSKFITSSLAERIYNYFVSRNYRVHGYIINYLGIYTVFLIFERDNEFYIGSSSGISFEEMIESGLKEIVITSIFLSNLIELMPKNKFAISNLPQHGLYYFDNSRKEKLLQYLDSISKDDFSLDELKRLSNPSSLDKLSKILAKNNHEVFFIDLTSPELRMNKLFVVKSIVLGFLDLIKNPRLAWRNYYGVKNLNVPALPMPFA